MKELSNKIKAGFGVVILQTLEETRALREITEVAVERKRKLYCWSLTRGCLNLIEGTGNGSDPSMRDPVEFLRFAARSQDSGIFVMLDPDPFLPSPDFQRALKDELHNFRAGRTLVMVCVSPRIPPEITHIVTSTRIKLPDEKQLEAVVESVAGDAGIENPEPDTMARALKALAGLTTDQAADACALSVVETGGIDPVVISREKCNQISMLGYIKIREDAPSMEHVGGLENVKEYFSRIVNAYSSEAQKFKLPTPKGIMLVGVQGCGKSLVADAAQSILKIPAIRLDPGSAMGSLVGETEKNIDHAIQIAESVAPCILQIEELDKQFGGRGDEHEVTNRMIGKLLTWLQEKKSPVFVIATANNVEAIMARKPELFRKGRWDEIFFVDLPTKGEREEIFKVHISKFDRKLDEKDVFSFANQTEGFSGAEIEACVRDGMFISFENERDLDKESILQAIGNCVPLSRMARETIDNLRKWADGRCRPASAVKKEAATRKIEK